MRRVLSRGVLAGDRVPAGVAFAFAARLALARGLFDARACLACIRSTLRLGGSSWAQLTASSNATGATRNRFVMDHPGAFVTPNVGDDTLRLVIGVPSVDEERWPERREDISRSPISTFVQGMSVAVRLPPVLWPRCHHGWLEARLKEIPRSERQRSILIRRKDVSSKNDVLLFLRGGLSPDPFCWSVTSIASTEHHLHSSPWGCRRPMRSWVKTTWRSPCVGLSWDNQEVRANATAQRAKKLAAISNGVKSSLTAALAAGLRVRPDHPLRAIRSIVDEARSSLEREFAVRYSRRASIAGVRRLSGS